jgi:VWFA-related protein
MNARLAAVAVWTTLAGVAAGAQVFRGGTDTVFLSVTVTRGAGQLIGGLDRDQFQVYEDGIRQEITTFSSSQQPIALSILLDTSTSMEYKLALAQEGAIGFVRRLSKQDVAQVIDFDNQPVVAQDYTSDVVALESAIKKTQAGGSTSLYNALYQALRDPRFAQLANSANEIRRRATVVLSDGEDTSSLLDYDEVLATSKRTDMSVYAIGLRSREDAPRRGFNEAEFVLRTLSQETGGRAFFVDDARQLPAVYQQIADELANQYSIGYTSKNPKRNGAWRQIHVRVTAPQSTARTKSGYFGPKDTR